MKNSYEIREMHICKFEKENGLIKTELSDYPSRLCVWDKKNQRVIDVETEHQYPYLKITNMSYWCVDNLKEGFNPQKRYACLEYASLLYSSLDSKTIDKCQTIINLLESNYNFIEGNEALTNEQYLEMVNSNKKTENKVKKFKKRK